MCACVWLTGEWVLLSGDTGRISAVDRAVWLGGSAGVVNQAAVMSGHGFFITPGSHPTTLSTCQWAHTYPHISTRTHTHTHTITGKNTLTQAVPTDITGIMEGIRLCEAALCGPYRHFFYILNYIMVTNSSMKNERCCCVFLEDLNAYSKLKEKWNSYIVSTYISICLLYRCFTILK